MTTKKSKASLRDQQSVLPTHTRICRFHRWPKSVPWSEQTILIYDRRLDRLNSEFRSWRKQFARAYPVTAGESLKDLEVFAKHVQALMKLSADLNTRQMQFLVVGGGSVGDFGGFLASVFKRGVRLTLVPSTWLAAMDSSHGGKNGLNVGGIKNQIGTFYLPHEVWLIRPLLLSQSRERRQDALGELVKMALIDRGPWVRDLLAQADRVTDELLWRLLPQAIAAKMRIVRLDPKEQTGLRQILNLGHTLGHVMESARGISHGQAVSLGLDFAVDWSRSRGLLDEMDWRAIKILLSQTRSALRPKPLGVRELQKFLFQDKKKSSRDHVSFIFLKRWGQAVRVSVAFKEILVEARRQGWVR